MVTRSKQGSLTGEEKKIIKRLLSRAWRNQDIHALINAGRIATINGARITEVKKNTRQSMASNDEVDFFIIKKNAFDAKTGLNFYDDERLIRSREAMVLAVQVFNSAGLSFKTEVFAVLVNVAWTYLLHEYYERNGVKIIQADGRSLLLSQMLERRDSPLSEGTKNNLRAMKTIRDEVEHTLLGRSDAKWLGLFQTCCLNFNRVLCELFGEKLTLSSELGFALQFSKIDFEQLALLNRYEIPPHIKALDARLSEGLSEKQKADLEYQFQVIYTLDSASKSRAHMEFVKPDSREGKEIRNVLVQYKPADALYPYKPGQVCEEVVKISDQGFSAHNHTQAWRMHKVRPLSKAKNPENTNKDYCIYHAAHKDYTYSKKWVDLLVECISNKKKKAVLTAFKLK